MVRPQFAWLLCAALALSAPAAGDWDPADGHKMHFPQEPDLFSTTGMDVCDVAPMRLADDFLCSESGLIRDVHVWVSWKGDLDGVLTAAELTLRADEGTVPGGEVWSRSFSGDDIVSRDWAVNPDGLWWYDPATGDGADNDHTALYQLNFLIEPGAAFRQTQDEYYWLEVSLSLEPGASEQVGWSTTRDNYGDGAVWWNDATTSWRRLTYPGGHEWAGETMDMAFVITPEPAGLVLLTAGAVAALLRRRR